ncbi:MAG: S41 family peptidase [Rhodospirillaceae bacterium]|nr:S41 family peptidase [Rhodospirillaceae bacterium]
MFNRVAAPGSPRRDRKGAGRLGWGGVAWLAVLASAPVPAQVNLDFEARPPGERASGHAFGWDTDGQAAWALDALTRRGGAHSLRVTSTGEPGRARFSQRLDLRGVSAERVRVSAYVKTDSTAGLRVRVEDDTGLLYIDRARAPGGGWVRVGIEVPLAPTATALSFGGELLGGGSAWFDDFTLEPVDTATLGAPSAAASRYVRYALSVIEEHALVRAALDWPAYRAAVMRQARGAVTVQHSYLAVRYALGALGDGHSHFMTAEQMATLAAAPVGNARTGRAPVAPRGERLGESIGYVKLPGFAGGSHMDRVEFAEGLQAVIARLDAPGACAWIVDLRGNSGGNLWPMLTGLGPLLGDGEVGASVGPDGERMRFWYDGGRAGLGDYVQMRVRGAPYRLGRAAAPVAVLTDDETASAAEILAAAFAAQPRTRSFGEATRGATTATRSFGLSDGAALVLAVASTSDRNGRIYPGPLVPDQIVSAAERGLALPSQPAVRAARDWLASFGCSAEHAMAAPGR